MVRNFYQTPFFVYREIKEAEIESRGFVNFTKAIFRN